VSNEIVAVHIPQKYQALHKILQQRSQQNQPKPAFENQKNDLIVSSPLVLQLAHPYIFIVQF
jgi:hypothetical protein